MPARAASPLSDSRKVRVAVSLMGDIGVRKTDPLDMLPSLTLRDSTC